MLIKNISSQYENTRIKSFNDFTDGRIVMKNIITKILGYHTKQDVMSGEGDT